MFFLLFTESLESENTIQRIYDRRHSMRHRKSKYVAFVLILQLFIVSGLQPAANAARIPTEALISSTAHDATRTQLQTIFTREDVRAQLMAMGVNPDAATNRLNDLTPAELQQLQAQMNHLPAGADGGFFAVLGIIFVVLLVLELVGVTNIFSKF